MKCATVDTQKRKNWNVFWGILCSVLILLGALALFSAIWYRRVYGDVGFYAIINTLFGGMSGVESTLVYSYLLEALLPTLLAGGALIFFVLRCVRKIPVQSEGAAERKSLYPFNWKAKKAVSVLLCLIMVFSAAYIVNFFPYVRHSLKKSQLYEEHYVAPEKANIVFPEKKRNVIYILLESTETTFFSKEQGGAMQENLIPELWQMADENVNFSHNDGVGGFYAPPYATWTIAAMVSQTAGIPLKLPLTSGTDLYGSEYFLPGATTLMDILHAEGYNQALMIGSDGDFAKRNRYFSQHGTDAIYDIEAAKADGIIPEDYFVWWGMEDFYLFDYAKIKLTEMAQGDEPFAFTLLTVDTHFPSGYVCEHCGDDYEEQYNNVYSCSSAQVYSFVEWIKQQDFYEDTVIVICGDHLTMDNEYIVRTVEENFDRRVYNCFINTDLEPSRTQNRTFCSFDIMPTILAAMGCDIEGDRLALGTNLFSDQDTLMETMGKEAFYEEVEKHSEYYSDHFLIPQ
ncbi:MAG: LTA synthase family protein [Clostridiales bacterium]|nr:LTA synthase family protein [Clostridiales bacterium]